MLVQFVQRQRELRAVEARGGLGELLQAREVEEELAARRVVQHEVQLLLRLEGEVQTHNEGVVDGAKHAALRARVLHLLALDDVRLVQHLHRVQLLVRLFAHQRHLRAEHS